MLRSLSDVLIRNRRREMSNVEIEIENIEGRRRARPSKEKSSSVVNDGVRVDVVRRVWAINCGSC